MKLELDIDFCNGFFYTLVEGKIVIFNDNSLIGKPLV
jgi:hypothetical protein